MKLHLGCGKVIKDGYVNIDAYVKADGVVNYDILRLPYENGTIDEIVAEHLVEHLGYADEERFWRECYRVLRLGGTLILEAPDMEWLCRQFLSAADEFEEFYQVGAGDHYFGHGRSVEHRWGILTTHFFGNQNGEGQFHKNGYTKEKMLAISKLVGFRQASVIKLMNKGAQAVRGTFIK